MDEQEWLRSEDPRAMLEWLGDVKGGTWIGPKVGNGFRASIMGRRGERRLQLFVCGCNRTIWEKLTPEERSQIAAFEAAVDGSSSSPLMRHDPVELAMNEAVLQDSISAPCPAKAALLRDIFGNPFQPVALPKCGRCDGDGKRHGSDRPFEWTPEIGYPGDCLVCGGVGWDAPYRTPTVLSLAHAAYDERAFDRLPILADALEDAGCREEAILRHLRGWEPFVSRCGCEGDYCTNPTCDWGMEGDGWVRPKSLLIHCRGCWVLDMLLGRE